MGRFDKNKAALTQGPIVPMMVRLTAQMTVGFVAMVGLNLMDAWFVSRLGSMPLAAIGFTFPVVLFVGSISVGVGIGTGALVSKAVGRGDWQQARRLTTDALILTVLVITVLLAVGVGFMRPIFHALGADDKTMPLVLSYMRIWWTGAFFVVVPMVGNNAIRATGDMIRPSLVMLSAVVLNGVLDPLLIFGVGPFPRMGVAGAALATVLARGGAFAMATYLLHFRFHLLTLHVPPIRELVRGWLRVLNIGVPAAGSNLVRPLSIGVYTALIAKYGPHAVAGFGVATKVEALSFIILIALATVVGPFVGQNFGARNFDRIRKGLRIAYVFALGWGVFVAVVLGLAAEPIARLFSHDIDVIRPTKLFLQIVPASYGVVGVFMLSLSSLNVLKRPWTAMFLSVSRVFVLGVPLALIGRSVWGPVGVYLGIALSGFFSVIAAVIVVRRALRDASEMGESAPKKESTVGDV